MVEGDRNRQGGVRILCADDEASVLFILRHFLGRQGHDVVFAHDGIAALEILRQESFPLVLTDISMPRMDGLELMRHIREHHPATAVIVVSAIADSYSFQDMVRAGAADFIQKPLSHDELEAKVSRVLREQRTFAALSAEVEERRRAEEALRNREEQYRSLVENIGIGVALLSPAMEVLTMNRQMHMWFPDVDTNTRPRCFEVFQMQGGKVCGFCPVVKALADGRRHEVFAANPSGNARKYYRIIASPVFDETGKVMHVIKMLEDYSERRLAEIALQEKQAQLVHAGRLTALGEMATAMAHEINQPLNVISITLQTWELLRQRGRLDPETMLAEGRKLQGNVDRITKIIEHVRSFGRVQQDLRPVSLRDVAREALSLCRMQFRNHGVTLEESYDEDVPSVPAVATEIEQVALNLLSNARAAVESRYGALGGKKALVRMSVRRMPERIVLTVEDNGGGVREEVFPRIFDPFFTTKPVGKGTGLGLSISRQIMEKFGGGLECDNRPGEGAVFTAWLPLAGGECPMPIGQHLEVPDKDSPDGIR